MTQLVLFYIFAAIAIIGAFMVITSRNPVRAVLSLVMTFVATAVLWLLLQVEFLALVLIVVYVGAVMVLFLFVVMMIDVDVAEMREGFVKYWPLAAIIGLLVALMLAWAVRPSLFGFQHFAAPPAVGAHYSSIKALGLAIFTQYLYPFELAAVLLLAAMVSAITLAFRGRRKGVKAQIPGKQVQVDPKHRLRVVKMKSESKQGKSKK